MGGGSENKKGSGEKEGGQKEERKEREGKEEKDEEEKKKGKVRDAFLSTLVKSGMETALPLLRESVRQAVMDKYRSVFEPEHDYTESYSSLLSNLEVLSEEGGGAEVVIEYVRAKIETQSHLSLGFCLPLVCFALYLLAERQLRGEPDVEVTQNMLDMLASTLINVAISRPQKRPSGILLTHNGEDVSASLPLSTSAEGGSSEKERKEMEATVSSIVRSILDSIAMRVEKTKHWPVHFQDLPTSSTSSSLLCRLLAGVMEEKRGGAIVQQLHSCEGEEERSGGKSGMFGFGQLSAMIKKSVMGRQRVGESEKVVVVVLGGLRPAEIEELMHADVDNVCVITFAVHSIDSALRSILL
uniref:Uncharacterized protein n=1 Tax=Palpitomonas bilix TaxID=652834 RepID=A0A7S3LUV5_9EUKA